MTTLLGQIAQIQVGYSFRSGIEPSNLGPVRVVQMKDVAESSVGLDSLTTVDDIGFKENHWILPGDLVFRSRGGSFKTSIIRATAGQMILAAPLIRIRPEPTVLPDYLNWYFGLESTQARLNEKSRGTTQLMVGIDDLKQLVVNLPDLAMQEAIVSIVSLLEREHDLTERVRARRQQLVTYILESTIHLPRSHS
jgi:hypothetical protein